MVNYSILEVVGVGLVIAQGVGIYNSYVNKGILKRIEANIRFLWVRANSHQHAMHCDDKDCNVETIGVIIKDNVSIDGGDG